MKKYLIALFALTPAFAANFAEARSLAPPILQAEITRVHVNSDFPDTGSFTGGSVTIDRYLRQAKLFVQRRFYCPPGKYCIQVMPAPLQVELPLVKVTKGYCGTIVYLAQQDKRPVDGMLEILEITDNSMNYCEGYTPLARTEIRYTYVTSGMGGTPDEATYTFDADKLIPNY